jgi:hypothetical protein
MLFVKSHLGELYCQSSAQLYVKGYNWLPTKYFEMESISHAKRIVGFILILV